MCQDRWTQLGSPRTVVPAGDPRHDPMITRIRFPHTAIAYFCLLYTRVNSTVNPLKVNKARGPTALCYLYNLHILLMQYNYYLYLLYLFFGINFWYFILHNFCVQNPGRAVFVMTRMRIEGKIQCVAVGFDLVSLVLIGAFGLSLLLAAE